MVLLVDVVQVQYARAGAGSDGGASFLIAGIAEV